MEFLSSACDLEQIVTLSKRDLNRKPFGQGWEPSCLCVKRSNQDSLVSEPPQEGKEPVEERDWRKQIDGSLYVPVERQGVHLDCLKGRDWGDETFQTGFVTGGKQVHLRLGHTVSAGEVQKPTEGRSRDHFVGLGDNWDP